VLIWVLRMTAGGAKSTIEQKKALAKTSHAFNLGNRKFKVSYSVQSSSRNSADKTVGRVPKGPLLNRFPSTELTVYSMLPLK
jgi:hypothetical protein